MIYYISDNKMFRLDGTTRKVEEIKSRALESYTEKVRENARRNEWKTSGSGAAFLGDSPESLSPDAAVKAIHSEIHSLRGDRGTAIYSITIDSISGVYSHGENSSSDGIVMSHAEHGYTDFDVSRDKIVVSETDGAETHIGIIDRDTSKIEILTEGESRERWPVWSAMKRDRIIYSGCGLAISRAESSQKPLMMMTVADLKGSGIVSCEESPYYVCALDLDTMELSELVTDSTQRYSYVKPHESADGYIYYIKKPYKNEEKQGSGCLSALLAPFRLLGALFGFLNFFTMKYSGKTLAGGKGNTKAKSRTEAEMFIDGNLVNAGKELERNEKSGDKFPGIIPRSYELCRRLGASGREEVIKRGVIAYAVDRSGEIYCSNGNHLLKLTPNGTDYDESVLAKDKAISFVSIE